MYYLGQGATDLEGILLLVSFLFTYLYSQATEYINYSMVRIYLYALDIVNLSKIYEHIECQDPGLRHLHKSW